MININDCRATGIDLNATTKVGDLWDSLGLASIVIVGNNFDQNVFRRDIPVVISILHNELIALKDLIEELTNGVFCFEHGKELLEVSIHQF